MQKEVTAILLKQEDIDGSGGRSGRRLEDINIMIEVCRQPYQPEENEETLGENIDWKSWFQCLLYVLFFFFLDYFY